MIRRSGSILLMLVAVAMAAGINCQAQNFLTHHVRSAVRNNQVQATGRVSSNQVMNLDVVLPLRDQAGLRGC